MLIQINYADIEKSESLEAKVREQVTQSMGHLAARVTRVEVHLRDDSSAIKETPMDKRCLMEARPSGMQPLVVEHVGDDFYKVVKETADKLARVVQKTFDRRADH